MIGEKLRSVSRMSIIYLCIQTFTANANIMGSITDSKTNEPIYFSNIFLANTTIGATSDKNGNFEIHHYPPGEYELVVHHIGYKPYSQMIQLHRNKDIHLSIMLDQRIIKGDTVTVTAENPKEWKKYLDHFIKHFIGNSPNAIHTRILNPERIDLEFDKNTGYLTAKCDTFIQIENNNLGYELDVLLLDFKWYDIDLHEKFYGKEKKSKPISYFLAKPLFKEQDPENKKQLLYWQKKRQETYKGSFRHFLSCAVNDDLEKESFHISRDGLSLPHDSLYITDMDTLGNFKLSFNGTITVHYTNRIPHEKNIIKLYTECLKCNARGKQVAFGPLDVIKKGKWGQERTADWLPFDYTPEYTINQLFLYKDLPSF